MEQLGRVGVGVGFAVVIGLLVAGGQSAAARAERPGALCRAACEARNVPASCAWLAKRPRRCRRQALRGCRKALRQGQPIACPLPPDLPGCLTNHACPFGALCADAVCQVIACGREGDAPCPGSTTCEGDRCLVAGCAGSTENCPLGFHCQPDDGPLGGVSGTCQADDPSVRYCTADAHCITPGEFNQVCRRGVCGRRRGRRRAPTTTSTTSTTSTVLAPASTTTSTAAGGVCGDVFDCGGAGQACCGNHCVPDPYDGLGVCSAIYTPACTLCASDDDCTCNGLFCDVCEGTASLSGCVDPCTP